VQHDFVAPRTTLACPNDDPMLGAVVVHLQRQLRPRLDLIA